MRLPVRLAAAVCVIVVGASQLSADPKAVAEGVLMTAPAIPITPRGATAAWFAPATAPDSVMPFARSADGTQFTVLRFSPTESVPLRVQLKDVRLPAGARLYIYGTGTAPPGSRFEVVEGSGPLHNGRFVSQPVAGEIIIEFQPGVATFADLPFTVEGFLAVPSGEESVPAQVSDGGAAEPQLRRGWYRNIEVTYEVRDGLAIFQNDIVLGTPDEVVSVPPSAKSLEKYSYGIPGTQYRWPNGIIPYLIDSRLPMQGRVTDAITHWNSVLGGLVRLVPYSGQTNHVYFTTGYGCSSSVGMLGLGRQNVYLADSCSTGNAIHEIGHAFGLWHEHTRLDRDSYVKILWDNIDPMSAYNFYQEYNGTNLTSYDFNSIMHYPSWAFTRNGAATIETIPPGIPIGQTSGLSSGDIAGIQALYGSVPAPVTTVPVSITSNPTGLTISVDGVSVTTPYSANWFPGSIHTISALDQTPTSGQSAQFVAWSDSGTQTHTIVVPASSLVLTANYAVSYQLFAQAWGQGTVSVSPQSGDGYYAANTNVTLTATPGFSACFSGWTGLLPGTPATTTLTMVRPYSVSANFATGTYTLSRTSLLLTNSRAVTSSVGVNATGGCIWSAVSNVPWIAITSGTTYTGSAVVTFRVERNSTGAVRTGALTIAGQNFTVRQDGR